MTGEGWVAASEINEGGYVLGCADVDDLLGSPYPDRAPSTFGEIFDLAAVALPLERVAAKAVDFHGDGFKADVDIVGSGGLLVNWLQAFCGQRLQHLEFSEADARLSTLMSFGSKHKLFGLSRLAGQNAESMLRQLATLLWAGICHAKEHGLGAVARFNAAFHKMAANLFSMVSKLPCDGFHAVPAVVEGNDLSASERFSFLPALRTARLADVFEATPPESLAVAKSSGKIAERGTLSVSRNRVMKVVWRQDFRGHVYNAETATGLYLANGILSHNCRCQVFYSALGELGQHKARSK
jgi:hypothetical protein